MARAFRSMGFQPYHQASQTHDNKTVRETEKHAIDPKFGRIGRKGCREKDVAHPKMSKTPPKFSAISRGNADASDLGHVANLSDNACGAGKRRAPPIRMLIISLRPLYSMSLWRNNGLSDEGKYAANLCDNHGTSI